MSKNIIAFMGVAGVLEILGTPFLRAMLSVIIPRLAIRDNKLV